MSQAPLPSTALTALHRALGSDAVLTDPADCLAYSYDNSRRMAQPQAVVFALNHEDVLAVVRLCGQHGIPLTARGRGTNTTGAAVPLAGGIVLSLERMNRILRISAGDRLLVCEAGTLNSAVQAAAAEHGLFWAPDPTSAGFSTVGGNLACGAGGPKAVKYGTARDAVLGLKAVDGKGNTLISGASTTKSVVGYDLTRLLVGSEGTLAIITEATLKLLPKPTHRQLMRAAYSSVHAAADAVARLMCQPNTPCALEFMDGHAVRLAEDYRPTGVPASTGALLLIEADGDDRSLPGAVRTIEAAASGPGLIEFRTAQTAAETENLWACRKALSPSLRQLAPKKVNEDVAVPVTRLTELIDGVQHISEQYRLLIVCFGHAGNGNIHVNILANPDEPSQAARIEPCLRAVFSLVLSLQGTISGEHGVGIDKRDYVGLEIDAEALAVMRAIKTAFDPQGILNPGKTLPSPE